MRAAMAGTIGKPPAREKDQTRPHTIGDEARALMGRLASGEAREGKIPVDTWR